MNRLKALTTALACVAVLTATTAAAHADPSTQTWNFNGCSGPAGTPTSFSAWRAAQSVGNALHLVDSGGTFVVLLSYNEDLGVYNVPVIAPGKTRTALVRCSTIGPLLGFHLTVWGILAS